MWHRHFLYQDPTTFHIPQFEQKIFDDNFIIEHHEASDSRPYTYSNIISKTSIEDYFQGLSHRDPDEYEDALQEQQIIQDEPITTNPQKNITKLQS